MTISHSLYEKIKGEFNTLWSFSKLGNTVEISTPYRMPDSTLFTLFLTKRGDRYIACDGGRLWELILDRCELPEDEAIAELRAMAKENGLKEGNDDGVPIFFKDCRKENLVGSISFDVASFATMAANVLIFTKRR